MAHRASGATIPIRPMIDLRYVKKLIEMVDESTVDSLEITSDKGVKIRISKSPSGRGVQMAPQPVMAPMVAAAPAPARPTPAEGVAAIEEPAKAPAKSGGISSGTSSPWRRSVGGRPTFRWRSEALRCTSCCSTALKLNPSVAAAPL